MAKIKTKCQRLQDALTEDFPMGNGSKSHYISHPYPWILFSRKCLQNQICGLGMDDTFTCYEGWLMKEMHKVSVFCPSCKDQTNTRTQNYKACSSVVMQAEWGRQSRIVTIGCEMYRRRNQAQVCSRGSQMKFYQIQSARILTRHLVKHPQDDRKLPL